MIIEDRTKQTASAVDISGGTYNIQLHGGTPADGHFPFMRSFFYADFMAPYVVPKKLHNVPVLIESGSEWILTTATLDLISETSLFALVPYSTNNPIKKSSGWSFPVGGDVTISVPASAHAAAGLHVKYTNIFSDSVFDPMRNTVLESLEPGRVGVGGGMASIAGGTATGEDAISIGLGANATAKKAIALGGSVSAHRVGGIVIGYGVSAINSGSFARGFTSYPLGAVDLWTQIMDGQLHAYTTNATPTNLKAYDEAGTEIAGSEWTYCDPGITHVKAIVTAVNTANNDSKVWELGFAMKNINVWGVSLALMGSLSKTVVAADAGAAAWDVGITVVPEDDAFAFTATGEAGKNIVWTVSYYMSMHNFYV